MRFLEWNSCLLFSPKGDRENNCALQYASFVISRCSVFSDVLVWIWSIHWNVKSDNTCGVRLKWMATSHVFLFVFMDDLWFLNLTLNSVVVEPTYWRLHFLRFGLFLTNFYHSPNQDWESLWSFWFPSLLAQEALLTVYLSTYIYIYTSHIKYP